MSNIQLRSIARQIRDLNVAKAGYTAFFVDGTNGSDTYTGESWLQAFKTIQHAVDEANSWTKIFVKAGTYAEAITIDKDNLQLIAAKQWVVIDPAGGGIPVTISAHQTTLRNIHALGATATDRAAYEITGNLNQLIDCKCTNGATQQGVNISGNENLISNLSNAVDVQYVIYLVGNENIIEKCKFSGSATSWYAIGVHSGSNNNTIHDNDFENFSNVSGSVVWLSSGALHNRLYHNNFISNNLNIYTNTTTLICFENFYDGHTVDTNDDGVCNTPYSFTGGTDYQPVSRRDRWKQESLGATTNTNLLVELLSRPSIDFIETWQDEAGIDATVWTVTDPATGAAWSRGASGAYLRATSAPNADETARLVSDQRWVAAPGTYGTNTVLRRLVLEFELKLTTVANIDNTLSFLGLTTGTADNRSTNNIIGFGLTSDILQSITDNGGTETVNTTFGETLTNWNKLKIDIYAGHVKFYVDEVEVADHATNLPDAPMYLNYFVDTEAGGAATIELGNIRVWTEDITR